ncbi:MAG TPA: ribonuclease P protein component [Candidatus Didemnitutus sp.]|nr:ribonuclease P protein component [Candidatus Didemnitutus sp.]
MRLRPAQRVRRTTDFQAMRQQGRRMDCGHFVLAWRIRLAPDGKPAPARVGVVASRASVGDAVERNRAKRRLREIFRQHQTLVPANLDLVLTARGSILRAEFTELAERFASACRRLPAA